MAEAEQLSRRERQIMDIVYAHGQATASQVLRELADPPTRTAVRTFLRILEEKGHLSHEKSGREFVFRPTHPRASAGKSALRRLLDVFFDGPGDGPATWVDEVCGRHWRGSIANSCAGVRTPSRPVSRVRCSRSSEIRSHPWTCATAAYTASAPRRA
jgi:predicted transcriptional regulator